MKLLQDAACAATNRKLIKSQVEKRRRERINRSLERLKTMLLPEPKEGGTQHRVEKAEILEHTVHFLQNTAKEDKMTAGGGDQKHPYRDGFSTCLQRAGRFLGPEGKGLQVGAGLDATFAARFVHSDSDPASLQPRKFLPHAKFLLRMLRQKSKLRLSASGEYSVARPYPLPVQQRLPRVPGRPQRRSEPQIRAEKEATKESSSQSPVSQALWRPWP